MKVTVSNTETVYNRASRRYEEREYVIGHVHLSSSVSSAVTKLARAYRMSKAEVIQLALLFYFGDGSDHLSCWRCLFFDDEKHCTIPLDPGEQITLPLLDKGSVVVGQPLNDQGEC